MELEKMSKYARKKALQAQQAAEDAKAERKAAALAAAFEAVKRQKEPPKPPEPKAVKPKPPEPPPKSINDLGDRPERLGELLTSAAELLKQAMGISAEIMALAGRGIQQAEPRAIDSFLTVVQSRVEGMALRAAKIVNTRQERKTGRESNEK